MFFAATSDHATFFGGFLAGALLLGMGWVVHILLNTVPYKHEAWINGHFYSTKRSHRIFGIVGEQVIDGHWVNWVKSVWQTANGRYFLLHIDEFSLPKILPLTPEKARAFIQEHAKENSYRIIRDWFKHDQ